MNARTRSAGIGTYIPVDLAVMPSMVEHVCLLRNVVVRGADRFLMFGIQLLLLHLQKNLRFIGGANCHFALAPELRVFKIAALPTALKAQGTAPFLNILEVVALPLITRWGSARQEAPLLAVRERHHCWRCASHKHTHEEAHLRGQDVGFEVGPHDEALP